MSKDTFKASVILAVYKDAEALECVLHGLSRQTEKDFEVIVAEDGDDPIISKACQLPWRLNLEHLTQPDIGFRKMRAVNRAIASARSPYLLFLDGDCVPHRTWVKSHLDSQARGSVLAGRRMHLGVAFSERLRKSPGFIANLESCWKASLLLPSLHFDGARNVEIMRPSSFLQKYFGRKCLNIVGCNFSAFRDDLIRVNGYDEGLTGVGGEDDDLHWRLEASGISIKNFKFRAIVYHLYHKPRRNEAAVNISRSKQNLSAGLVVARQGVDAHLDCRMIRKGGGFHG